MSASWPPSTRSTSASTVASPHSSRWLPRTQRSPGCVTGSSGGSGDLVLGSSVPPRRRRASSRSSSPSLEADQVEVEAARRAATPAPAASSSSSPSGLQRELVVGDQIRPLLRLAQVLEPDHRHLGPARASAPPAAGRGRRGCRSRRRPAPGWSSRTRPCSPRSAPPAHRCGCAGCAHTGSARPAAARRSPDRPSSEPHKRA